MKGCCSRRAVKGTLSRFLWSRGQSDARHRVNREAFYTSVAPREMRDVGGRPRVRDAGVVRVTNINEDVENCSERIFSDLSCGDVVNG